MRLRRLEIQQLPGIEPGFVIDAISPRINLVTGPNASGKSSLIRALQYLVAEPQSGDPGTLSLSASFDEDGVRWTVARTGRQQQWQRDGQTVERPSLPEGTALRCYWLTMEDLAVASHGDQELVEQLRKALTGGYDLRGLRDGLFQVSLHAGRHERKMLRQARDELRRVESDYESLRHQEQELPELKEQAEAAKRASEQAGRLEQALTLESVLAERQRVEADLATFPSAMNALRGNEAEQLERLESLCHDLQGKEEGVRSRLVSAEQELEQTGMATARPSEQELEATRARLDEQRHWQQQLETVEAELDRYRRDEQQAWSALAGDDRSPPQEPPRIGPGLLSEAEALAGRLEQNRVALEQIHPRDPAADGDAIDEEKRRNHWRGVDVLEQWLAAVTARATIRRARPGLWLGTVGALAALVLSALGQAWWVVAASGAGLCGVLWSLYVQSGSPDTMVRNSYLKLDLPMPDDWTIRAVRALLETLRRDANAMERRRDQDLADTGASERRRELEEQAGKLGRESARLAAELGFEPDWEPSAIRRYLHLIERYEKAHRQRRDREERQYQLRKAMEENRGLIAGFLERWEAGEAADRHDLAAAFEALTRRARRAEEADRSLRSLRGDLDQTGKQLRSRRDEIDALYRTVGLEPGDRQTLDHCLERLEEWRTLNQRRQELTGREREPRHRLADHADLVQAAESGEREALTQQLDACHLDAEQLESLRDDLSRINAELRSAGSDPLLEKALHRVDQEKSALADTLREQLSAEAGRFLLDEIEQEHQSEHEPDVLREARELFGRFTHQGWDVEVGEAGLLARDRRLGELRPLAALSSGTRMQLLLAVRLAWTRRLERGGLSLPLFLDEALTTSDESRFAEVADSLALLCREEGRQVFYLSARRHELALWEQAAGEAPHHIDMAERRFGKPGAVADDYVLPPRQPVPAPEGESPEAYAARLSVPVVEPWHAAGDIHLFHLLRDDLPLLHRLMQEWRITTLGQLEGLLHSSSAAAALPEETLRYRLAARCITARRWREIWRQGRNRPVDSIALQQAPAVTDTFLEPVSELAEAVGGDPEALLDGLRNRKVARFRTSAADALQDWLEEHGHITPGEPLDADERLRQVLLDVGAEADPSEVSSVVSWLESG
ncbi:MAG: hypothetical protein ACQETO_02250 [Pseudomonadota bacterium]